MDILLDTDACVHLINGSCHYHPELEMADVGISSITAYELQVGVEKSKSQKVKRETRSFLKAVPVFHFDDEAAIQSAKVRAALEKQGKGIGPYDTLIAGHCLSLGRMLFTGNKREFERVPKLSLLTLERI
jgi:tRNA(fMet)-specific endonuclease VapC